MAVKRAEMEYLMTISRDKIVVEKVTNDMEKWAKLIHFTGGEISWIKSWFQLLSWKLHYDREEVQSAQENGIKICMRNIKKENETIQVKHEDAKNGLRYLGV